MKESGKKQEMLRPNVLEVAEPPPKQAFRGGGQPLVDHSQNRLGMTKSPSKSCFRKWAAIYRLRVIQVEPPFTLSR